MYNDCYYIKMPPDTLWVLGFVQQAFSLLFDDITRLSLYSSVSSWIMLFWITGRWKKKVTAITIIWFGSLKFDKCQEVIGRSSGEPKISSRGFLAKTKPQPYWVQKIIANVKSSSRILASVCIYVKSSQKRMSTWITLQSIPDLLTWITNIPFTTALVIRFENTVFPHTASLLFCSQIGFNYAMAALLPMKKIVISGEIHTWNIFTIKDFAGYICCCKWHKQQQPPIKTIKLCSIIVTVPIWFTGFGLTLFNRFPF